VKLENASYAAEKAARRAEEAANRVPSFNAPSPAPRRTLSEAASAPPSRSAQAEAEPLSREALERELANLKAKGGSNKAAAEASVQAPAPRRNPETEEELFAKAKEAVRPGLAGLMRFSLERSR